MADARITSVRSTIVLANAWNGRRAAGESLRVRESSTITSGNAIMATASSSKKPRRA